MKHQHQYRAGAPEALGFERAPQFDRMLKKGKARQVWRFEGVLFVLPPGCRRVRLEIFHSSRGDQWIVREPDTAATLWPAFKKVTPSE